MISLYSVPFTLIPPLTKIKCNQLPSEVTTLGTNLSMGNLISVLIIMLLDESHRTPTYFTNEREN